MPTVSAYKRPASLEEALVELEDNPSVLVGGGTKLHATTGEEPVVVVDLQAAGLAGVWPHGGDSVVLGATTTLDDLASSPELPEVVRQAARREQPSSLRTLSTLGGCVASADFESELLATLLVYRATVSLVARYGTSETALADLLTRPSRLAGRIITAVEIETSGRAAVKRVARTPADRAIVAAVARRDPQGTLLVAFSGVARVPVLVDDPETLEPPGDFRGSSEYRKAMAEVLGTRAREALR
ncbi:MAG TPA: FAD binding domain-containing protein [Acidimicrobiales bacterium]|nr:FAD binding domain-containing protein [Acidimicrobiales bacterium]